MSTEPAEITRRTMCLGVAGDIESARDSHRDARQAHLEVGASLSIIADKLTAGDVAAALAELDAARLHYCVVGDAHREIGRYLNILSSILGNKVPV